MEGLQEKRNSPRFNCRVPVLCRKGTMFDNSQTIDISRGGVGIISPKFVPLGTNLVMEIALAPKAEPVLAVGSVKWVQKISSQDNYRLGLGFTDISRDSHNRLSEYLER